jgi:hypothetical protein
MIQINKLDYSIDFEVAHGSRLYCSTDGTAWNEIQMPDKALWSFF